MVKVIGQRSRSPDLKNAISWIFLFQYLSEQMHGACHGMTSLCDVTSSRPREVQQHFSVFVIVKKVNFTCVLMPFYHRKKYS